jgi:hypothetical protein
MSEHELHVATEAGVARALHPHGDGVPPAADADESLPWLRLERRVAELERELAQMRGREEIWRAERSRLLTALATAEGEVAELPALRQETQRARDAAYWLAVVQSSWSWRLTRPLRAATRLAGRVRGRRRAA